MFKYVVLCAFIASATADPAVVAPYPLAYSGAPLAAPFATSYVSPVGGVYQPALAYSSPYGFSHLIKKRSADPAYGSFFAPTTYVSGAPLATTYTTPYVSAASILPAGPLAYTTAAHLIKKRSADPAYGSFFAPTTYVSGAPLATTYTTPYVSAAPILPAGPLAYTTAAHLIKKRSAPFAGAYVAPTTYAAATPFVASAYSAPLYSTPYVASAPVYSTHFIKKRSAPLAVSPYFAPSAYSTQTRVDYSAPSYVAAAPISYASPYATVF